MSHPEIWLQVKIDFCRGGLGKKQVMVSYSVSESFLELDQSIIEMTPVEIEGELNRMNLIKGCYNGRLFLKAQGKNN